MSVKIEVIIENELYEVNGKPINVDSEGRWITQQLLNADEQKAVYAYQKALIQNQNSKVS